jgi:hypothetical protein
MPDQVHLHRLEDTTQLSLVQDAMCVLTLYNFPFWPIIQCPTLRYVRTWSTLRPCIHQTIAGLGREKGKSTPLCIREPPTPPRAACKFLL